MTTYYPFSPTNRKAPTFIATLDGQYYTISILWNVSAQRYYLNCQSNSGVLIFMVPLVETDIGVHISTLTWDDNNNVVTATLTKEHSFPVGEIVNVDIVQAVPTTYNGSGMATIISKTAFTYPMKQDPGQMEQGGIVSFLVSMTKSYFNSTLVYRNKQFEVSP
jgi:hypothetical protein